MLFSSMIHLLYLAGVVPKELANLRNMKDLDLRYNDFEGRCRV